jgi:hypothetical protein
VAMQAEAAAVRAAGGGLLPSQHQRRATPL